jgi:hypothetical protein
VTAGRAPLHEIAMAGRGGALVSPQEWLKPSLFAPSDGMVEEIITALSRIRWLFPRGSLPADV